MRPVGGTLIASERAMAPLLMAWLGLMDRQNQRAREGDMRDFKIEVSDVGEEWRTVK